MNSDCLIRWEMNLSRALSDTLDGFMKSKTPKPLFNISISEFAVVGFIIGSIVCMTIPALNRTILLKNNSMDELIFPEFIPFNPDNGWPYWLSFICCVPGRVPAAMAVIIILGFIRWLLPEKLKPYLTWRKLNE
tara:strand:- start:42382 stop:42783 length:402 start_codon:yes stop_codon:yes gene_type:complete